MGGDPPVSGGPLEYSNTGWLRITPWGGLPFGGYETAMRYSGVVGLPSTGGGDGGIRPIGGLYLLHPLPEHHLPIYRNSSDI